MHIIMYIHIFQTFKVGIPGFEGLLHSILSSEVKQFTKQATGGKKSGVKPPKVRIPTKGMESLKYMYS